MLIMPLVDFYATGCDWLAGGVRAPHGLGWFLGASFFNGVVIETGRKLRAPADEEKGVGTYTTLWGVSRAPVVWLVVLATTAFCAWQAARPLGSAFVVGSILGALWLLALAVVINFRAAPTEGKGKRFETLSGIWTLALYLTLGALPFFLR
jgi:4-hydroxybenzoate polyprenyltransferase